jgi:FkbM family methyltransferase
MRRYYPLFPFEDIPRGSKIAVYGAGAVGSALLAQALSTKHCEAVCCADKKEYKYLGDVRGVKVVSPDVLPKYDFDYLVIGVRDEVFDEVLSDIYNLGIERTKLVTVRHKIPSYELVPQNGSNYGYVSFSQHGEDMAILNIFHCLGIEKPSYIDVGANDPYEASNTALLYLRGSRGINIDANPHLKTVLESERPEDTNLSVGVGAEPGILTYYSFGKDNPINTFLSCLADEYLSDKYADNPMVVKEAIEIPVVTLWSIVDDYANGVWADYLDVDVEGMDYEILNSVKFTGDNKPKVICVEVGDSEAMIAMLRGKGYEPYCRTVSNLIFVRAEIRERLLT